MQVHKLPKHLHNCQNTPTIVKTPPQLSKHPHNCKNTHTIVKTPPQLSKHPHNCQNTPKIVKTPPQLSKHPHNCQNTHTIVKTQYKQYKRANTSTQITKTPPQLSKHPHITKPTHTHTHTHTHTNLKLLEGRSHRLIWEIYRHFPGGAEDSHKQIQDVDFPVRKSKVISLEYNLGCFHYSTLRSLCSPQFILGSTNVVK